MGRFKHAATLRDANWIEYQREANVRLHSVLKWQECSKQASKLSQDKISKQNEYPKVRIKVDRALHQWHRRSKNQPKQIRESARKHQSEFAVENQ